MLGFRGASRYIAPEFYDCFALECEAMKRVRDDMGFTNVEMMIPFVRTLREAEQVIALLAKNGLRRGDERPARHHDVRDPVERDARRPLPRALRRLLDRLQRHDAADARRRPRFGRRDRRDVRRARRRGEGDARRWRSPRAAKRGSYVGICGQGPSDHPDLAQWLVEQGIESMSLNPDTVVDDVDGARGRQDATERAQPCRGRPRIIRPADFAIAQREREIGGMRMPPSVHVVLAPSRTALALIASLAAATCGVIATLPFDSRCCGAGDDRRRRVGDRSRPCRRAAPRTARRAAVRGSRRPDA